MCTLWRNLCHRESSVLADSTTVWWSVQLVSTFLKSTRKCKPKSRSTISLSSVNSQSRAKRCKSRSVPVMMHRLPILSGIRTWVARQASPNNNQMKAQRTSRRMKTMKRNMCRRSVMTSRGWISRSDRVSGPARLWSSLESLLVLSHPSGAGRAPHRRYLARGRQKSTCLAATSTRLALLVLR